MEVFSTFNFQLKRNEIFYYIFLESVFLVLLICIVFVFFFKKGEFYFEIFSSYECGFDPKSVARLVFSYKFFLISILFVIFDVEISLIIPIPFFIIRELGQIIFFLFIIVLIIGLLYEYYYGSLDWLCYYNN